MSATYLSKIERGELVPPSEEKIRTIARQFAADEDEFLVLAGRIPSDLSAIIQKQPRAIAAFLRTANGLTSSKIEALTDRAARMKNMVEARPHRSGVIDETHE
jgi:transcriptional regulator with XRE-family HTH domain